MWNFLQLVFVGHKPTPKKIGAHEFLSLLFQRTRVTDKLIVDGSKEQVVGNYENKCLESGCPLK